MARRRMLDPDFFLDEEVASVSPHARLLYEGMWCLCDDHFATLPNRPMWIKAQIFPYEDVVIGDLLRELENIDKITVFESNGDQFWYIKNFFKHQRVEKPSRSKYPEYRKTPVGDGEEVDTPPAKEKLSKEKRREVESPQRVKFDPGDMEMVDLLISLIQRNNPSWNMKGSRESWAEDIQKLNRIDKRTYDQIRFMIEWTQNDKFWCQNILSAKKLREKFNDLIPKVKGSLQANKPKVAIIS